MAAILAKKLGMTQRFLEDGKVERVTVLERRGAWSRIVVPDQPIIPFIEGDGTGPDIWRASVRVLDAAVQKAYGGRRKIHWMEVYAGQKSNDLFNTWLPEETVAACREWASQWRLEAVGDAAEERLTRIVDEHGRTPRRSRRPASLSGSAR